LNKTSKLFPKEEFQCTRDQDLISEETVPVETKDLSHVHVSRIIVQNPKRQLKASRNKRRNQVFQLAKLKNC